MSQNGKFELRSLIALYQCSDGKLRAVEFRGKDAKQVHGYLSHIQGGRVRIKPEPLLLTYEHPEIVALIDRIESENAEHRTPNAERPMRKAWRAVRNFFRPSTSTVNFNSPL